MSEYTRELGSMDASATAVYGPVRTVAWQGSAGDRRPYADHNALVGSDERHSQRLNQIKSLSPHHRFVIALHSPVKVTETGLRMCRPEKGRQIDTIRSRAVRPLQFVLRTKYCEVRACLAYFAARVGADSLQFRLAGGEGGIRTLGTGLNGVIADVCVSYRESIFYPEIEGLIPFTALGQTSAVSSPIKRRMAGDSAAESGLYDASQAARLLRT